MFWLSDKDKKQYTVQSYDRAKVSDVIAWCVAHTSWYHFMCEDDQNFLILLTIKDGATFPNELLPCVLATP